MLAPHAPRNPFSCTPITGSVVYPEDPDILLFYIRITDLGLRNHNNYMWIIGPNSLIMRYLDPLSWNSLPKPLRPGLTQEALQSRHVLSRKLLVQRRDIAVCGISLGLKGVTIP